MTKGGVPGKLGRMLPPVEGREADGQGGNEVDESEKG